MNAEARPKIFSQDDAHIDPAKRVGLHQNLPSPEHSSYGPSALGVTASNDHSRQARRRVSVAEEDNIDAV
jgi:hypothetical protein